MKNVMIVPALATTLLFGGGCSLWPWGASTDSAKDVPQVQQEAAAQPAPEPQPLPQSKHTAKTRKEQAVAAKKSKGKATSVESMEVVQQKLDVVGKKLVRDAAANVVPNINKKEVTKDKDGYVAKYVAVDTNTLRTEVLPSTGSGGQYVGCIKYVENVYECRGKTRNEALKAPCSVVKSRRMNELIRYDGKWAL